MIYNLEKRMPPKEESGSPEDKEVCIYSLATTVNECVVFLEEMKGNRLLPIWIGLAEGQAIAIPFSGIAVPRPSAHDLFLSAVKALGWNVEKITLTDLKENTFYAQIHLRKGSEECFIDSRPSDAIAVAVRAGCSMYVKERVFERCEVLSKPITEDEVKKFKEELKNLKPEDIFPQFQEKKGPKGPSEGKREKPGAEEGKRSNSE